MAGQSIVLLQMVNISVLLTSLTLCGALYYHLGRLNPDLLRARLFLMAPGVRRGFLELLAGLSLILVWESLLPSDGPPAVWAYAFDVAGQVTLLLALFSFYGLVKPQTNLLGVADDEIGGEPEVPEGPAAGPPGGGR